MQPVLQANRGKDVEGQRRKKNETVVWIASPGLRASGSSWK
jgi:hypothetical protein